MRTPNIFDRIGLWLAGVPQEHVASQPATRMGRVALGYALAIAPMLGAAGAFVTMRSLGFIPTHAMAGAFAAAALLLILDRAIFINLGKKGGWFAVGIRLMAAGLVNTLVSHVLVLSLFSGEIEREQRGVEAAEIARETDATTDRVAPILASLRTRQKQLEDELAASRSGQKALLARRETLEKELAEWRVKLDDEIQGHRASGVAKYGPEAKRIEETFVKPLENKQNNLSPQINDYDRRITDLTDQIRDIGERINRNPQVIAETEALRNRITEIHDAQRGDILSRTRALHVIMGREKELLGLYLVILAALFLLDTAAILTKATATRDAADCRREMETHGAVTDLDVFKQQYEKVATAKEAVRANLEIFRDEVNAAKATSIERTQAFVGLLAELATETKVGIANAKALVGQISAQGDNGVLARELNSGLVKRLIRALDSAMHDFFATTGEGGAPTTPSSSPKEDRQQASSSPNPSANGHSGNGNSNPAARNDRF